MVIPDSHVGVADPALIDAQMQWIVDNKAALNIQMVLHEGDLVEDGGEDTTQYDDVTAAIGVLDTDGGIPYLLATGNHDHDAYPLVGVRDLTVFNTYFPQSRYTARSWWNGGFYEAGHSENAYCLRTISGVDYIFLTLELFPRAAVIAWADALLTTYAARQAIIVTHGFMFNTDVRLDRNTHQWGPDQYGLTDGRDGEQLWDELISQHANVVMVLSGHVLGDGIGRRVDANAGNYSVHQILANYQQPIISDYNTEGGQLRVMTVKPSSGTIEVSTYSPHLDAERTGTDHDFTIYYRMEYR